MQLTDGPFSCIIGALASVGGAYHVSIGRFARVEAMQRVRKFFVTKVSCEYRISSNQLEKSSHTDPVQCHGWHQSWDTAIQLMVSNDSANEQEIGFDVAIVDEGSELVIAIFSSRNLEGFELASKEKTSWKSARVSAGANGYWCNSNYSDFGWGWVSGAQREVPFRLRYLERRAEANPDGLISRTRAWLQELREWVYGHGKKIG